jgi:hypothetical protein
MRERLQCFITKREYSSAWDPTRREFDRDVRVVGCGVEVAGADAVGGFGVPFDEERVAG